MLEKSSRRLLRYDKLFHSFAHDQGLWGPRIMYNSWLHTRCIKRRLHHTTRSLGNQNLQMDYETISNTSTNGHRLISLCHCSSLLLRALSATSSPFLSGPRLTSPRAQVEPQEKKKTPKGRAKKRITYTRRFVNVTMTGGKRKVRSNPIHFLWTVQCRWALREAEGSSREEEKVRKGKGATGRATEEKCGTTDPGGE